MVEEVEADFRKLSPEHIHVYHGRLTKLSAHQINTRKELTPPHSSHPQSNQQTEADKRDEEVAQQVKVLPVCDWRRILEPTEKWEDGDFHEVVPTLTHTPGHSNRTAQKEGQWWQTAAATTPADTSRRLLTVLGEYRPGQEHSKMLPETNLTVLARQLR